MTHLKRNLLFVLLASIALLACRDDEVFYGGSDAQLDLRTDTVFFDTVFTHQNPRLPLSVNMQVVVVNNRKEAVKSDFNLMGGANSVFRINVDGEVGPEVKQVEIPAGDSVFVFIELHIDPNNDPQSLPLIVRDSISINTNGNMQHVQLMAWGQDAHYYLRDTVCDVTLSDKEKPYVVYGYLYVPENCKLTIEEGVRMHFASRSWLYVEGTLEIKGSKDEKVVIQGDRLDPDYEETAGQWGGIWLDKLSRNNSITHALIKNGTVGIYCDSTNQRFFDLDPIVRVNNTEVRNMSFDGLSGKTCHIIARNSIFANCGRYSFLGLWGGIYDLKHCNFVTYGYDFGRRDPTFVLNNFRTNDFNQIVEVYPIRYDVANNIIDGGNDDEVGFGIYSKDLPAGFISDTFFHHNLVRNSFKLDFKGAGNVTDKNADFTDPRLHNYNLEPTSGAINIGDPSVGVSTDFYEEMRDGSPDAGAIEFKN